MVITGSGVICPIGMDATAACAAKRASISAFKDVPGVQYKGEPVVGAVVPGLAEDLGIEARLVALFTSPLAEITRSRSDLKWPEVPLLIGLAENERPGGGAQLAGHIIPLIETTLGITFHHPHSLALPAGHTACLELLRSARELFQMGIRACVIACADSLVNAETMSWLHEHLRLKSAEIHDGVIPGEAGAAILVESTPAPNNVTEVVGLGFGKETAHLLSGEPLLGLGLTEAARQALAEAHLGLHEIDGRLSDVTGETYGFKELPLVTGRLMRELRRQDQPLWHWADAIGDSGAAAGVLQIVLAHEAFKKKYAPGDRLICLSSALDGRRAAAVLRRCGNGK